MYLGFALMLGSWAVLLQNGAELSGVPLFVLFLNRFQIRPEERVLAEKFGAPYREYLRSVRRWI